MKTGGEKYDIGKYDDPAVLFGNKSGWWCLKCVGVLIYQEE